MKDRITALVAGLVALFGLSSCLEIHQTIELEADGTGTITEEMVLGAQMIALLQSDEAGLKNLYDKEKYEERAATYSKDGKGVTLEDLKRFEDKRGKGVIVVYKFKDINNVKFSPGSVMDEPGADKKDGDAITFRYEAKLPTITIPGDQERGEAREANKEPVDPEVKKLLTQMFKDMKVSAKIKIKSGIAEKDGRPDTDAKYAESDTITLVDLDFGEIVKSEKGLGALQMMEEGKRAEMQKALAGVKGAKVELGPQVTVKVK